MGMTEDLSRSMTVQNPSKEAACLGGAGGGLADEVGGRKSRPYPDRWGWGKIQPPEYPKSPTGNKRWGNGPENRANW